MSYRVRKAVSRWAIYAVLLVVALVVLLPFFWMVSTAFKPSPEILRRPPTFLPQQPTLDHFRNVFKRVPYVYNLYNSLFVSAVTTVITIFFSTMTGYGLAKFKCRGLNVAFVLILTGLMIPPFTIAIPLYIVATQLGMVNTLWGVIIPFAISNFGIFMMRQYCLGVPDDLIAAARIDGAGEFSILMRIVFPVVATGCAALGILKFLMTWNDFFWPLIMLTDDKKKTLQVVISTLIDFEYYVDFGLVMAATTLVVLPVILLFFFFQKRIIEGVAISGMKG
jgi:multiple sugar transport system permease protein